MIYSSGRRLAFVHIPHTGGTSIESAYKATRLNADIIAEHGDKHLTALAMHLRAGVDLAGFKVIAVTRNPWDRLHSHYHHGLRYLRAGLDVARDSEPWRYTFALGLRRIKSCGSFSAFVEYWTSKPVASWEFYCQDSDGGEIVNHVLHFDQLGRDWRRLIGSLGLRSELPHLNRLDDRVDYRRAYTDAAAEAVGEFCKLEIEKFGHTFEGKRL